MAMTINLFLIDGTPDGRIRYAVNTRSGIIFRIPRKDLAKCKGSAALAETDNDSVYFLLGEEDGRQKIYVGQAGSRKNGKGLLNRLNEHARSSDKNFWTEAIVFTTSNNSFGPTEISWLENKFHDIALNAGRYEVVNSNEPSTGNITAEKASELEDQVEFARLVLGAVGYKIFEPPKKISPPPAAKSDEEIFYLTRTIKRLGRKITAQMKRTQTGFRVLAGSEISPQDNGKLSSAMKKRRLNAKIVDGRLLEDVEFNLPSPAATFVIGNSANGYTEWKTRDGLPLKNFLHN